VINFCGTGLRDFCAFSEVKIKNSFYRHKEVHKFTWEGRGTRPRVEYVIISDRLKSNTENKSFHMQRN
jgi:hypothetical protein